MSGNTFGKLFRVTTWGESHGRAVGVVVDGCPAGLALSAEDIQKELDRRRPGQSKASTQRKEEDLVEILSGLFEGKTTGTPISMIVWNKDADSGTYDALKNTPRPGHADYTYQKNMVSVTIVVAAVLLLERQSVASLLGPSLKSSSSRRESRS